MKSKKVKIVRKKIKNKSEDVIKEKEIDEELKKAVKEAYDSGETDDFKPKEKPYEGLAAYRPFRPLKDA